MQKRHSRRRESSDDREVAALVSEEQHWLFPRLRRVFLNGNDLFVSERIGGEAHRRVDVVARQPEDTPRSIRFGSTFAQPAKQQFNRYPRPSDHRLAEHDVIDFDSVF